MQPTYVTKKQVLAAKKSPGIEEIKQHLQEAKVTFQMRNGETVKFVIKHTVSWYCHLCDCELNDAQSLVDHTSGNTHWYNCRGSKGKRKRGWFDACHDAAAREDTSMCADGKEAARDDTSMCADGKGRPESSAHLPAPWERRESRSKPGTFYYYNLATGISQEHVPQVQNHWSRIESNASLALSIITIVKQVLRKWRRLMSSKIAIAATLPAR